MRVKKFLARTLPEAVTQVKADLGPEAIILHTQPIKIGGLFGLFAQRMIEVTAAAEPPGQTMPARTATAQASAHPLPPVQPPAPQPAPVFQPLPAVQLVAAAQQRTPTATAGDANRREGDMDNLRQEMERMSGMMNRVLDKLEAPASQKLEPVVRPIFQALVEQGVEQDLATALTRKIQNRIKKEGQAAGLLTDVAREVISKQFGVPQPIQAVAGGRRIVALMGPTGVGKTTTLAKLAAFWSLRKHLKVALITADTYRIAAVEQLRTYCEIIRVPLEVVESPDEVAGALQRYHDAELVLVDTAGRSHRNHQQITELEAYLQALQPHERYLVLSLTASNRDVLAVTESYSAVGFDRFLFTKLDEAMAPGITLNVLNRFKKTLSYVTTGQNVPDDIEVARPDKLSQVMLGDLP